MPRPANEDLYAPQHVRRLFDEMAATYGVVNLISSLGFTLHWRRQCARAIRLEPGAHVLDLMTGMGELCPDLVKALGHRGRITALDISPVMCGRARRQIAVPTCGCAVEIVEADALCCPLAESSVDYVFSSFGLKTFEPRQLAVLAGEIARVLRPGGRYSLLEISVPPAPLLRWPFMAYLRYLIPMIGRIFMGNPDNYRLLSVYTQAFGSCASAVSAFQDAGLEVALRSFFFGCATGLCGFKPGPDA